MVAVYGPTRSPTNGGAKMNSPSPSPSRAPERQSSSSEGLPEPARPPAPLNAEQVLSWGRYPRAAHRQIYKPAWNDQIPEILNAAQPGGLLPFGQGRSYGDSCLNAGRGLVQCGRLNRILGFEIGR